MDNFLTGDIHHSGKNFFEENLDNEYFSSLLENLDNEYEKSVCWPKKENVFRIFREMPADKIKVVILGQDPYHSPNVADGYAFSTQENNFIPASLRNIFIELNNDLGFKIPKKGDLTKWVKQGVFLINTSLTVKNGLPLSHVELGKKFIYSLIDWLKKKNRLVWVFGGYNAKKIKEQCQIDDKYSIVSAHPSPFSANNGFFNSKPFSRINYLLASMNKKMVDGDLAND